MFKKIYEKIDLIKDYIRRCYTDHESMHKDITQISNKVDSISRFESMAKVIESQQRTIEQLTNALKDKYEHGLFVLSEDCKAPMVIRNGEDITGKYTNYFSISWSRDTGITMETECRVGTAWEG